jgi:hypothetical protein
MDDHVQIYSAAIRSGCAYLCCGAAKRRDEQAGR